MGDVQVANVCFKKSSNVEISTFFLFLYLIRFWRLRSKGLYKATRVPIYF